MLHGLKDQIANPNHAKNLFERVGSLQKRFVQYGGGFHELFSDTESNQYKLDILTFLGEVLVKDPPALGMNH